MNQEAATKSNVGLLTVLKNVKVIMALSGTVFGASVQGLLEANLEQFLEGFDLSINQIGYSFLGLSIPYFIVSPCWGYTCDHWVHPKIIQPLGHVVTAAGLLILAPVSYLTPNVSIQKKIHLHLKRDEHLKLFIDLSSLLRFNHRWPHFTRNWNGRSTCGFLFRCTKGLNGGQPVL